MSDRPQNSAPIPTRVPMIKEETVKDDGRTLIYYSFPEDHAAPAPNATQEDAHV